MLTDLLRRLSAPEPDRLSEPDAGLALAALMVRVARSDGTYAPEEVARIDRILMRRHALTKNGAAALRAEAETLEAGAPDTVRFTRAIKRGVPLEQRIAVIEALWAVVLADGERDDEEDGMLRLLANLLGIGDLDSNLARQRAEAAG